LAAVRAAFGAAADALLACCDPSAPTDVSGLDAGLRAMEARYHDPKSALLAAGADTGLALIDMTQAAAPLQRTAQPFHNSRRRLADGREP
jgi:hypothetical protein